MLANRLADDIARAIEKDDGQRRHDPALALIDSFKKFAGSILEQACDQH
jgi:hypothetical protein